MCLYFIVLAGGHLLAFVVNLHSEGFPVKGQVVIKHPRAGDVVHHGLLLHKGGNILGMRRQNRLDGTYGLVGARPQGDVSANTGCDPLIDRYWVRLSDESLDVDVLIWGGETVQPEDVSRHRWAIGQRPQLLAENCTWHVGRDGHSHLVGGQGKGGWVRSGWQQQSNMVEIGHQAQQLWLQLGSELGRCRQQLNDRWHCASKQEFSGHDEALFEAIRQGPSLQ